MTINEKIGLKRKVYDRCLEMLEESAQTTRNSMAEIQEDANEAELEHDVFDGTRDKFLNQRDIYAEQLQNIMNEIQTLKKVTFDEPVEKVEFGAMVLTNKQNMFVVVGIGKVEVEGETFFVISKDVPIFKAMQGMKKGDQFEFNNNQFEIKDVF
jgi:transcription elongation GreA/GreB family factor